MLLNNQIDPQRATAITNCCNAVLSCIRLDEQQKRIDELEKLLQEVGIDEPT
nr:MAG TPA: Heat shock factor binding protein 1 [Caudoviricetes sp.]DAL54213.1 MAG TPA_asm: Heat shock factor binding protein 1 [Caudoviricetes sp.]DAY99458.1 MAG TPA: Heat shock factor binding protein 1 [Caudoviricetes sp.]